MTLHNLILGAALLGFVLMLWHSPIFKPWFGFRKPKGHKGHWGE